MGISVVSIQGMNSAYENIHHTNIFDGISLTSELNKDELINRIVIRCGEFSVMHTDIEWFHEQIINFFLIHYDTFDKWAKVLKKEYEPLENYDRIESWNDWGDEEHEDGRDDETSLGSSQTQTKAAFNSSSYEPYEKTTGSGKDSFKSDTDGSSNFRNAHNGRVHGNIGVTTSQQMLQSEIELRRFNIYKEIANLFADEFVIQVY